MIDPSLLTKFRKTRITEDILEENIKEKLPLKKKWKFFSALNFKCFSVL